VRLRQQCKSRILIVDDTPHNLRLLDGILTTAGYAVTTASSGQAALDSLETQLPDLVLLDIMMPQMDGLETCRRMREKWGEALGPIVFVTAMVGAETKAAAYDAGGVDYIPKPFDRRETLLKVGALLEGSHLRRRLREEVAEKNEVISTLDRFSQLVAHDLKNPLSSVEGLMDTLIDMRDTLEPADQEEIIHMIHSSTQRMRRQVDTFLLLSRLRSQRPSSQPIPLNDLVSKVLDSHQREMERLGAEVGLHDLDRMVMGVWEWLEIALGHLVANAVEHGGLRWEIRGESIANQRIRLSLIDDGDGVPPSKEPMLFLQQPDPGLDRVAPGGRRPTAAPDAVQRIVQQTVAAQHHAVDRE